ncbi:MAG: hypothetical protein JWN70_4954 [Planctomycetaceae bacterium]|nr:hypothetical protein [Planctomycetaceae bacterium]
MSDSTQSPRPVRERRWWILWGFGILFILSVLRLCYPPYRQWHVVDELRRRGYNVETISVCNDKSPAWLKNSLGRVLIGGVTLSVAEGAMTPSQDDDLRLAAELVSLTYGSFEDDRGTCDLCFDDDISVITDHGLANLRGLTLISSLRIKSPKITDSGVEYLKGLLDLEVLILDSPHITDVGLTHLKSLTNLSHLQLKTPNVNGSFLVHSASVPRMEVLILDHSQVDDACLVTIGKMIKLKCLGLGNTPCYRRRVGSSHGVKSIDSYGPVGDSGH